MYIKITKNYVWQKVTVKCCYNLLSRQKKIPFMVKSCASVHLFVYLIYIVASIEYTTAQSIPTVPTDLRFADVSVYLSGAAQLRLQQEIQALYMNHSLVEHDINALRQLTPLWQPYFQDTYLPLDFRYAALPSSTANTAGYWSISPQQAELAGLRVDEAVDERMHPAIAAEKITSYLRNLHEKYQENYLRILLRYIKADGRDSVALKSPEQNNVASVWLDVDSPPLIWKILARKIVVEYEEPTYRPALQYMVYSYQSSGGQTIVNLARQLSLPSERFQPYNDWLKTEVIPIVPSYPVLIWLTPDEFPAVRMADRNSQKTAASFNDLGFPVLMKLLVHENGLRSPAIFYTINGHRGVQAQPCDNVITLAFYGDISVAVFLAYNDLNEQDVVRPGQIYYLERKDRRAKIPFHVMQRNQSLREVSDMYGVRFSSLLRFNSAEPTQRIGTGRIIWLQKKRPRDTPIEYRQLPAIVPVPLPTPEPILIVEEPQLKQLPTDTMARQLVIETKPAVLKLETIAAGPIIPVKEPKTEKSKPAVPAKIHIVKAGQTYYAISQLYSVTPKQLYIWNDLAERIPLEIGQELIVKPAPKLPDSRPKIDAKTTPKPAPERLINRFVVEHVNQVSYYTVKPGQTVYRIALINKVSIDDIMEWNNLKDYTIEVGQKLTIRKPRK